MLSGRCLGRVRNSWVGSFAPKSRLPDRDANFRPDCKQPRTSLLSRSLVAASSSETKSHAVSRKTGRVAEG